MQFRRSAMKQSSIPVNNSNMNDGVSSQDAVRLKDLLLALDARFIQPLLKYHHDSQVNNCTNKSVINQLQISHSRSFGSVKSIKYNKEKLLNFP